MPCGPFIRATRLTSDGQTRPDDGKRPVFTLSQARPIDVISPHRPTTRHGHVAVNGSREGLRSQTVTPSGDSFSAPSYDYHCNLSEIQRRGQAAPGST